MITDFSDTPAENWNDPVKVLSCFFFFRRVLCLHQMPVQCVEKMVELQKIILKQFFCNMSQSELRSFEVCGIRVALYRMVPSMLDVTVSLTLFSPVWWKYAWLPRGMELGGLSSDHLQKQLNMSPVSVLPELLGGWTWGISRGWLARWLAGWLAACLPAWC